VNTDTEGDGATSQDPVETNVQVPSVKILVAGQVTISEGQITHQTPAGYTFFGQQVTISSPTGNPTDPNIIIFTIDASIIPAGQDEQTIQVFRNGVPVPNCTGPGGDAVPDPCISKRNLLVGPAAGDVQITVLTSAASIWNFGFLGEGVPTPTPPKEHELGDVNGDGEIDSQDAIWVLWFEARLVDHVPAPDAADVNEDGNINVFDALFILQFHARLIHGLPAGVPSGRSGGWASQAFWSTLRLALAAPASGRPLSGLHIRE
jgi:hypothetical protein